jgi:hypothetical protein
MSDVAQLMRAANPVPDSEAALADDEFSALLLLTQSRSGNVDVQELTKPVEPEKKQRSGWLVAAAAFAVVIVVVGAAMLLTRSTEELPPATTPPPNQAVTPTTPAAPPTTVAEGALSPAQQSFVDEFVSAFNAGRYESFPGDFEEYLSYFAPDATVSTSISSNADLEQYRLELAFRGAMNHELTLVSCREEFGSIRCQVEASSDDLSVDPRPLFGMSLQVDNGLVTSLTWSENIGVISRAIAPFYDWVSENHAGTLPLIRAGESPGAPKLTGESIELWIELLPEYKASLDG